VGLLSSRRDEGRPPLPHHLRCADANGSYTSATTIPRLHPDVANELEERGCRRLSPKPAWSLHSAWRAADEVIHHPQTFPKHRPALPSPTQGRDGRTTRRHHRGILRRGVWCASRRPPLVVCLFLSPFAVPRRFSLQPSCHLAVSSHSRRSLSLVASSSVASLSSASSLRRRRRLPIPCSRCFSRLSSQLCPPRGIFWPLEFIELSSRKDDSSDAHCDHLPPSHIVAQVHSLFGHLYFHR